MTRCDDVMTLGDPKPIERLEKRWISSVIQLRNCYVTLSSTIGIVDHISKFKIFQHIHTLASRDFTNLHRPLRIEFLELHRNWTKEWIFAWRGEMLKPSWSKFMLRVQFSTNLNHWQSQSCTNMMRALWICIVGCTAHLSKYALTEKRTKLRYIFIWRLIMMPQLLCDLILVISDRECSTNDFNFCISFSQ